MDMSFLDLKSNLICCLQIKVEQGVFCFKERFLSLVVHSDFDLKIRFGLFFFRNKVLISRIIFMGNSYSFYHNSSRKK